MQCGSWPHARSRPQVSSGLEKTSVATVATSTVVLYSCCEGIRGDGAHGLRQRLHHQADLATVVDEGGSWYLHGSPLCLSAACAGLARKYKMLHVQKPLQRDIPVLLHDGTIHSALPGLISPKFGPKKCPATPPLQLSARLLPSTLLPLLSPTKYAPARYHLSMFEISNRGRPPSFAA